MMNLRDLNISTRLRNALYCEGVETVEQLCKLTEADIMRLPNVGRRSLNELNEQLQVIGLKLGMAEVNNVSVEQNIVYRNEALKLRNELSDLRLRYVNLDATINHLKEENDRLKREKNSLAETAKRLFDLLEISIRGEQKKC